MDAHTLANAMGHVLTLAEYKKLCKPINEAMVAARCTNLNRAAVFLGEIREESVGLKYSQEIGSDSYLQSKPYFPYIGRGFIQVTWSYNYASFGAYCHSKGWLKDPKYFVKNPHKLADSKWAPLTCAWYWSEHHGWKWGTINNAADHQDWDDASHQINGGDYGLNARRSYIQHALSLGNAILPEVGLSNRIAKKLQKEIDEINARIDNRVSHFNTRGKRLNKMQRQIDELQAALKGGKARTNEQIAHETSSKEADSEH